MVVGLVNASLLTVFQGAGVDLGAAIGTTITAQLIALDLSEAAPLFIAFGVLMRMFSKRSKFKIIGDAFTGFGLLFLGIGIMSTCLKPLAQEPAFINILTTFGETPILGLLAGMIVTAIIQSSSASIGILQALAMGGAFVSVSGGVSLGVTIPILLGMNIGTCITAVISTVGTGTQAKRSALIHLIFKIFGAIWFMIVLFIIVTVQGESNFLYDFIIKISGNTVIDGATVPDVSRQIANTHMLYNIINALILIPLLRPVVKLSERIMPEKQTTESVYKLRLDDRILENPTLAIGETLNAVCEMGELAHTNFNLATQCYENYDELLMNRVSSNETMINRYDKDITRFLVKIGALETTTKESEFIYRLHQVVHNIERLSDITEKICTLGYKKADEKVTFSDHAQNDLEKMVQKVDEILSVTLEAMKNKDSYLAETAKNIEKSIDMLEEKARTGHIDRMMSGDCSAEQGVHYLEYISDLERVGDYGYRLAQFVKFNL